LSAFCGDQVGLRDRGEVATGGPLLQTFGVIAAVRAHRGSTGRPTSGRAGETRPLAVAARRLGITFLAVGIPLLLLFGLTGPGGGLAAQIWPTSACRAFFLARLFNGFGFLRHSLRRVLPSIPGDRRRPAPPASPRPGRARARGPRSSLLVYAPAVTVLARRLAMESRLIREAGPGTVRAPPPAAGRRVRP